MRKSVLLVEGLKAWRHAIEDRITTDGFAVVDAAADEAQGLRLARRNSYDAAVVDLHLGGGFREYRGLSLIRALHEKGNGGPILILSAHPAPRIEAPDRTHCMFCPKGEMHETLKQVTGLLKARLHQADELMAIERGALVYAGNRVYIRDPATGIDAPVEKMSRGELRILRLLMSSDTPLPRTSISQETNLQESSVESLISRIRRKLETVNPAYGRIESDTTPNGKTVYSLVA